MAGKTLLCPWFPRHVGVCSYATAAAVEQSYYQLLGVSKGATHAEIKKAYYKLSKIYHPDTKQDDISVQKFREISEAYQVLGNLQLRRLYDRGLLHTADGFHHTRKNARSDFAEVKRHSQPGTQKGPSKPVKMSGQTRVYDYDAWQQAHYSELRSRRSNAVNKYDRTIKSQASSQFRLETGVLFTLCMVLGVLVYAASVAEKEADRPRHTRHETDSAKRE